MKIVTMLLDELSRHLTRPPSRHRTSHRDDYDGYDGDVADIRDQTAKATAMVMNGMQTAVIIDRVVKYGTAMAMTLHMMGVARRG